MPGKRKGRARLGKIFKDPRTGERVRYRYANGRRRKVYLGSGVDYHHR